MMNTDEEIAEMMDQAESEIKEILKRYDLSIGAQGPFPSPTLRYECKLPSGNIYVNEREAF